MDFTRIFEDVKLATERYGVQVGEQPLKPDQAGTFNGVSVTMNRDFPSEDRAYYLAHSLGSIVRWSLSREATQHMFDELRSVKKDRENANRLEQAIAAYRGFEIESSEFAVWLLNDLQHENAVPSYTNFMRADLEALTAFHRTGEMPVWPEWFARWNEEIAAGRGGVPTYRPKPIPPFTSVAIECQEILQKQA